MRSLRALSAPLIRRCLTDRVDLVSSTDFIARCSGVSPLESTEFTSTFHASRYAIADSDLYPYFTIKDKITQHSTPSGGEYFVLHLWHLYRSLSS